MRKTSNFFKITLIYFISILAFVGLRILFATGVLSGLGDKAYDILSSVLIQVVIMVALPFLFYYLFFKTKPKQTLSNLGFKKISPKAILICFGIGIVAFLLNVVVSTIFNGIIHAFGYESATGSGAAPDYSFVNFLINVFCVAILPALCEEFLHRGILMRGLFNSISVKHALILSSICFGLMHLNIVQVFYAAILGLLIGFVSIIGKSIWPAVIIHFTNNFINVYLSFAEPNGWFLGGFYDAISSFLSNHFLIALLVVMVVVILLLFLLIKLVMDLFKITSFESFKTVLTNIKKSLNPSVVNYHNNAEIKDEDYIKDVEPILLENLPRVKNTEELFFQDYYPKEKLEFKDKIILISTLFLGVIVTIFTFIWGIL